MKYSSSDFETTPNKRGKYSASDFEQGAITKKVAPSIPPKIPYVTARDKKIVDTMKNTTVNDLLEKATPLNNIKWDTNNNPKKKGFIDNAIGTVKSLFTPNNPKDVVKAISNVRLGAKTPEEQQEWARKNPFIPGLVDSVTLGLNTRLADAITGGKATEINNIAKESNPLAYGAGELAGYIVPGAGAEKLAAKGLEKVGLEKLISSKLSRNIIRGTAAGATLATGEGLARGDKPKDLLKRVENYSAFGAGGEAANNILGVFIPKIVSKIKNANPGEIKAVESAVANPKDMGNINTLNDTKTAQNGIKIVKVPFSKKSVLEPTKTGIFNESKLKTNTLKVSKFTQGEPQKVLDDIVATYEVKTNKATLDNVTNQLENNFDKVVGFIKKNGLQSKEDSVAAGLIFKDYIQEASVTGDYAKVKDWVKTVRPEVTNVAQTLQGLSQWKTFSPESALMKAQQVIDTANTEAGKAFGKMAKKLELTDDDTKYIIDKADQAYNLPEGRGKKIAVAQLKQYIGNLVPNSLSDKIAGLQRISLLLNPKTMIRNIAGNAIYGALDNVSNVVATPIDKLTGLVTKNRTTTLPSIPGQIKSAGKEIENRVEDAKLGIDTSPFQGQFDLPTTNKLYSDKNIVGRGLNKLHNITKAGLQFGDSPFAKAAYDDVLRQQMKLKGTLEPTEEMIAQATDIAKQRTYQDVNNFTEGFKKIQLALNKVGSHVGVGSEKFGLGNLVVPFVKTPANILARAVEYSPIGITKAVKETISAIRSKGSVFNQKAFVDSIAKGLTGTGLIKLGYELSKRGIITGAGNKDTDVAALQRSLGMSDYSFHIGDNYFTYDWMQPTSIGLAMGADIYNSGKNKNQLSNVITDAINSGGQTLFKQSLLQGLQRFMGGTNPIDSITSTLMNTPTQAIPTLSKQIDQLTDPTQRQTYNPDNAKTTLNLIKNKIPGLSNKLQPKIDTFGNETKIMQGKNNLFNVFINPGTLTDFKPNDVQKEILRLYDTTGEKTQFPRVASKNITYTDATTKKSSTIQLSPDEYTQYQKRLGQLTMDKFSSIISNKLYKISSDENKVKKLQSIIDDANKTAKNEILKSRGLIK